MMVPGLVTGFAYPRGADDYRQLAARGIGICRVQLNLSVENGPPDPLSSETAQAIIDEVLNAGLRPLVTVRMAAQLVDVPIGVDVELGNEPDLEHNLWTPESYRDTVEALIPACEGRNPLWIYPVSNLNDRGFRFLRSCPWNQIPPWVGCCHHWYPDGGAIPEHAGHDGRNRGEEVTLLRDIVGNRRLAISEINYNLNDGWSEGHVAAFMAWEKKFWTDQGYTFACAYQIDDTDPPSYGFRDAARNWRPVLDAWVWS